MREHFISLPKNVYSHLLAVAETQGIIPADWIASQLPPDAYQSNPLTASLSGLIGVINSQVKSSPSYNKTVFYEAL